MESLGKHIIIEYYNCKNKILDNPKIIEKAMLDTAQEMKATIVTYDFHHFSPYGVSGMIIISESHLSIHTWPEYNYAAVDLFTCGDEIDPWLGYNYLKKILQSENTSMSELKRGVFPGKTGSMPYKITKKEEKANESYSE